MSRPWPTGTVKSLRRNFEVTKPVASVRVYATALGAYKLFVNGRAVGDQILSPGWTDFREHVVYQAYDVSDLVKQGKNASGRCWRRDGIRRRCNGWARGIITGRRRRRCGCRCGSSIAMVRRMKLSAMARGKRIRRRFGLRRFMTARRLTRGRCRRGGIRRGLRMERGKRWK